MITLILNLLLRNIKMAIIIFAIEDLIKSDPEGSEAITEYFLGLQAKLRMHIIQPQ